MGVYILDTETTGIVDPVPVEVAWIKVNSYLGIIGSFVENFNPGKSISFGAMSVHHIVEADVIDEPPFSEFELPADCEYIIGHNVDFDWTAIGKPNVKRICTLALSRMLWPETDSHNLSALVYFLTDPIEHFEVRDILIKNAHSAYGDCRTVLSQLLVPIIKKLKITFPIDWEILWKKSEEARIPTVMPWGKHRGLRLKDVPEDYKRWLKSQPETDPYILKAFELEGK
ncbi:MAG: 3'-5' exonuclease [Ferrovum sp.]|jgi:exodeoxyribonuclease X|nr:3'-5' exonuclease [Ferrovum sp.]